MRAFILSIMAVAFIGCQSTQNSWHLENDVIKNTKIKRNPAMWTSPYTEVLHQECPKSSRVDATMHEGFDNLKFSECVTMKREVNGVMYDHWDQAFEPGTLNGLGGSLIQAGAILGGASILANGLKHQGSGRLNTGVNNSYNTTQNCYSRDCY